MNDADLVAGLRRQDAAAWERLVAVHSGRLLAVIRRYIRDEAGAEDVLQTVWLNVVRAIDGFAGDALLSTWLHRIAVNAALMSLRKRRPVELDEDAPIQSSAADPLEAVAARETAARAAAKIDALPDIYRSVLRLAPLLPRAEVARALGIGLTAFNSRLRRGRIAVAAGSRRRPPREGRRVADDAVGLVSRILDALAAGFTAASRALRGPAPAPKPLPPAEPPPTPPAPVREAVAVAAPAVATKPKHVPYVGSEAYRAMRDGPATAVAAPPKPAPPTSLPPNDVWVTRREAARQAAMAKRRTEEHAAGAKARANGQPKRDNPFAKYDRGVGAGYRRVWDLGYDGQPLA